MDGDDGVGLVGEGFVDLQEGADGGLGGAGGDGTLGQPLEELVRRQVDAVAKGLLLQT